MAKIPFSIRVPETTRNRFKALAAVTGKDGADLLDELVNLGVLQLNEKEEKAMAALLDAWEDNSEKD